MPIETTVVGEGDAPTVASAVCLSRRRAVLYFSELMADNADLIDAANYTFTEQGGASAVTVTAAAKYHLSTRAVVLTVSADLTEGVDTYEITAAAVTDVAGNVLGSPDSAMLTVPDFAAEAAGPAIIQRDGGYTVTVSGVDSLSGLYRVSVGPIGSEDAYACMSTVQGRRDLVLIGPDDASVEVVVPPLPIGDDYGFYFERVSGDGDDELTTGTLLEVVERDYRSRVYTMRALFAPSFKTGARSVQRTPYPAV